MGMMTFTKILCPTDFSPGAERALQTAARLASQTDAELVIAHSWFIPSIAFTMEAPFPPYVTKQIVDDAQRGLDDAVRLATAAGAKRVSSKLLAGPPWAEVVKLLEEEPFDLCVIGTHGRTGLARILMGSVAERVIRHSPCSTLAVRLDSESGPFSHALVPTDFSDSADRAVDVAATLVQPNGKVDLLYVLELPVAYSGEAPDAAFVTEFDKRAAVALDQTVARLRARADITVTARTRIGYPGAQTLHALDSDPTIDLVVMGSHGRTGIKRALLGSVAEKVVRHARCPVFVARKRP